ncbi:DUF481 domain-containing protein [Maribacter polysaccharolyticus]|uniref:DUF481 domain-containing protein n=1 Tax=Maribacter polysaccharolyticus TaxID=3020831 RepID=UPI00237F199F|nr:DUF481 domain-containing protein [Maribacter polysaccharolyticus]MDE3742960.1 DUF481 domain-containing protein [Maribacter polysaccharolyticus]
MELKRIIPLVVLFSVLSAKAQLVNIEAKRMQTDSTRFVLKSDLLFNYADNNGDYVMQFGSNISTQFKSRDLNDIYFLVLNYNLVRTDEKDVQNAWFLHARYNHEFTDFLRLEAFIQNQNNTQLTIINRNLVGAGVRLKVVDKENSRVYFGNSYMYEIEKLNGIDQRFYNHRNSSYLSLTQSFDKMHLDLVATVYFQPLYRDIGNHRVLGQLKAEIPLTDHMSLSALYNYFLTNFSSALQDDRSSTIKVGFTFNI